MLKNVEKWPEIFKNPAVTIMLVDLICWRVCCQNIIEIVHPTLSTLFYILESWRDARIEGYIISCKREA